MVAPGKHEVDEERYERRHQQNVIKRGDVVVDNLVERRGLGTDAHFLDGSRQCGSGGWIGDASTLVARVDGRGFGWFGAFREQCRGDAFFEVLKSCDGLFGENVDAFRIRRHIFGERSGFCDEAENSEVQDEHREAADDETGGSAAETQLHKEEHHGVEEKGDDHRDDDGNKEDSSKVQQRDGGRGRDGCEAKPVAERRRVRRRTRAKLPGCGELSGGRWRLRLLRIGRRQNRHFLVISTLA